MTARFPRVVLTRALEKCEPWKARLDRAGVPTLVLPLVHHETIAEASFPDLATFDWILFVSPHSVRAFFESALAERLDATRPRLGVLADGTAAELERAGRRDDLGVRALDGAGLAAAFRKHVAPPASVLLPGPQKTLPEPAESLVRAGFRVTELALYRTVSVPRSELPENPLLPGDVIFFASPSAVEAFVEAYDARDLSCAALGETTAGALRDAGLTPAVAERPDLESLCAAAGIELTNPRSEEIAR